MIYDKKDWQQICKNVADISRGIFPHVPKKSVRSAIISSVFETQTEKYFQSKGINLLSSKNDRQPDLHCKEHGIICEVKVTGLDSRIVDKTVTWLGGRYSKRNSDHIFIGWYYSNNTLIDDEISFFVLRSFVTEDDWKDLSKSKDYYGVGFKSNLFFTKDYDMLVGDYFESLYEDKPGIFTMESFE